jgi:hypothetical protein
VRSQAGHSVRRRAQGLRLHQLDLGLEHDHGTPDCIGPVDEGFPYPWLRARYFYWPEAQHSLCSCGGMDCGFGKTRSSS